MAAQAKGRVAQECGLRGVAAEQPDDSSQAEGEDARQVEADHSFTDIHDERQRPGRNPAHQHKYEDNE